MCEFYEYEINFMCKWYLCWLLFVIMMFWCERVIFNYLSKECLFYLIKILEMYVKMSKFVFVFMWVLILIFVGNVMF